MTIPGTARLRQDYCGRPPESAPCLGWAGLSPPPSPAIFSRGSSLTLTGLGSRLSVLLHPATRAAAKRPAASARVELRNCLVVPCEVVGRSWGAAAGPRARPRGLQKDSVRPGP